MSAPVRTCIGCRRRATPDHGWVRIAAPKGRPVMVGREAHGRGAWVCSPACRQRGFARRPLERALHRSVSSTELEALRAKLRRLVF